MSQTHEIKISPRTYPNGLRIFECKQCRYAFAAEVNNKGTIQFETRVPINHGDQTASHTFFQTPQINLFADFSLDVAPD